MPNDNTVQPITDDAELAKVLDGMKTNQDSGLSFEENPANQPANNGDGQAPADANAQQPQDQQPAPAPAPEPAAEPASMPQPPADVPMPPQSGVSSDLDSIKKSALEELRPLVDKLELPADEKFDTILLIIRSTDDQSLVNQAYEVAKSIEDDTKRAEALLDIIKEIDYFANPAENPQP